MGGGEDMTNSHLLDEVDRDLQEKLEDDARDYRNHGCLYNDGQHEYEPNTGVCVWCGENERGE